MFSDAYAAYYKVRDTPKESLKYEDYLEAVKVMSYCLEFVPSEHKTYELCVAAVQSTFYDIELEECVLEFVPEEYKDSYICMEALKTNIKSLSHTPRHLITREFLKQAEALNDFYVFCAPRDLIKPEDYYSYLKNNPGHIEYVPEEHRTREMYEMLINHDLGRVFPCLPEEYKTRDICIQAFNENVYTIGSIPEKYITYAMCLKAIQGECGLEHIPEKYRSYKLCLIAVKKFCWNIRNVPEQYRIKELCLEAVAAFHKQFANEKEDEKDEEYPKVLLSYIPESIRVDVRDRLFLRC